MVKFTEHVPFVDIAYSYEVEKVLYRGKSKFQDIMVFTNPQFGKMLILDGAVQITERDEFFYHEMITHPLMHAHPNPKRVVVIGGGDGGTVREVLKHKSVEKVYFVEIDPEVIRVSREFFPTVAGSVGDPRVEIKNMDGAEFIKSLNNEIDVVIVDSTDPIGFARSLFSEQFLRTLHRALTPEGMYVTQSESMLMHADIVREIQETIKKVFPLTDLYSTCIATYPGNWWTFSCGSKSHDMRTMRRPFEVETKYYDDEIHAHSFMPKRLYARLMVGWHPLVVFKAR